MSFVGLSSTTLRVMARLLRDHARTGASLSFGVQRIVASWAELREILASEGVEPRELDPSEVQMDLQDPKGRRVHNDTFFRALGFSTVESMDYFPDEGPTHQLDLNHPLPDELRGRYDLVCDGGTTEHCFNVPQVLTNAVQLLAPGGSIVHVTPISGWLTHGFYQFCPSLYFHFYAENGFTDLDARINYRGRTLDPREFMPDVDFLGRKALLIFVARKAEAVEPVRWPIQGEYSSPEVEALVQSFGRDRRAANGAERRSVYSLRNWSSDVGEFLKRYVRLTKRSRLIRK
jgi:SAM-dependent methyltransferase